MSKEYLTKKEFYKRVLTIYGRNPVIEALDDDSLKIHRLHLSTSNRPSAQLKRMLALAKKRGVEICYHEKRALSRISKNGRQDQGVALDIVLDNLLSPEDFLKEFKEFRLIALDRVNNPQNVGMIIRSCAAGFIDGVLLSKSGTAPLVSPLTIKASAGTLFKIPIIQSDSLPHTLNLFKKANTRLYTLDSHAAIDYRRLKPTQRSIFIVGNEHDGVGADIAKLSDERISIPMNRGVESLNVAVSASLLAFCL